MLISSPNIISVSCVLCRLRRGACVLFFTFFFLIFYTTPTRAQAQPETQPVVLFPVDLEDKDFNATLRTVYAYSPNLAYIGGGGSTQRPGEGNFIITYRKNQFMNGGTEYWGQSFGAMPPTPPGGNVNFNTLFGGSSVSNQVVSISMYPQAMQQATAGGGTAGADNKPNGFFVSRAGNGTSGLGDNSYIYHFTDEFDANNPNGTGLTLDVASKHVSNDKVLAVLAVDKDKAWAAGEGVLKSYSDKKWTNYSANGATTTTTTNGNAVTQVTASNLEAGFQYTALAANFAKRDDDDTLWVVGNNSVFLQVIYKINGNGITFNGGGTTNNINSHIKTNKCAACTGTPPTPPCTPPADGIGAGLPCYNSDTNFTDIAVRGDTIWITTNKGAIYKSTDKGKKFAKEKIEKGEVTTTTGNGAGVATTTKKEDIDPEGKGLSFNTISFPTWGDGYAAGAPDQSRIPLLYEHITAIQNPDPPRTSFCCTPATPAAPATPTPLPQTKSEWKPSALSDRYIATAYPTFNASSFLTPDLGWFVGTNGAVIRYAPDFAVACAFDPLTVNGQQQAEQGAPKKGKLPPNQYFGNKGDVSLINLCTAEVAVCSPDEDPVINPKLDPGQPYSQGCCGVNAEINNNNMQFTGAECTNCARHHTNPVSCHVPDPPVQPAEPPVPPVPAPRTTPTYEKVVGYARMRAASEWRLINRPVNLSIDLPDSTATKTVQVRVDGQIRDRPAKASPSNMAPTNIRVQKFDTTYYRIRTLKNPTGTNPPSTLNTLCYDTAFKASFDNRKATDTLYRLPQVTNNSPTFTNALQGTLFSLTTTGDGQNINTANLATTEPFNIGVTALVPNFSLSPLITPVVFAVGRTGSLLDTLFVVQPALAPYIQAKGRQPNDNTAFTIGSNRRPTDEEPVISNAYQGYEDSAMIQTNTAYEYTISTPAAYDINIDGIMETTTKDGTTTTMGKIKDTPILRKYDKYILGTFNEAALHARAKWNYINSAQPSLDSLKAKSYGPCSDPKMRATGATAPAVTCASDSVIITLRRDPLYYKLQYQNTPFNSSSITDTNSADYNEPFKQSGQVVRFEANGKPIADSTFILGSDTRYMYRLGMGYQKFENAAGAPTPPNPNYAKDDYSKDRVHIRLQAPPTDPPTNPRNPNDTISLKDDKKANFVHDSLRISDYDTATKIENGDRTKKIKNGITDLTLEFLLRKSNYLDSVRHDTLSYIVEGYHSGVAAKAGAVKTKRDIRILILEQAAAELYLLRQGTATADNQGLDMSVPEDADDKINLHYYQDSIENGKNRRSRDSVFVKSSVKWHFKTKRVREGSTTSSSDPYGKGFGVWYDTISVPSMVVVKKNNGGANPPTFENADKLGGDGLHDFPADFTSDTVGKAVWQVDPNTTQPNIEKAFPKIIFRAKTSNMTDEPRKDSVQICALEDFVCKTVYITQDTAHLSLSPSPNALRTAMVQGDTLYFTHKKDEEPTTPPGDPLFARDSIRVSLLNGGMWEVFHAGCFTGGTTTTFNTYAFTGTAPDANDSIPQEIKPNVGAAPNPAPYTYVQDVLQFKTPKVNMTNHRRSCRDSICAVAPEIVEKSATTTAPPPPPNNNNVMKNGDKRRNEKGKYCHAINFIQDTPTVQTSMPREVTFEYYIGAKGSIEIGANENYELILPDFVKLIPCTAEDGVADPTNNYVCLPGLNGTTPTTPTTPLLPVAPITNNPTQTERTSTCMVQRATAINIDPITNCVIPNPTTTPSLPAKHDFKENKMTGGGPLTIERKRYCFEVVKTFDEQATAKTDFLRVFIPGTKDSVRTLINFVHNPAKFDVSISVANIAGSRLPSILLGRQSGNVSPAITLRTNARWQATGYDATRFEVNPSSANDRADASIRISTLKSNEDNNALRDSVIFSPTDVCQTNRHLFTDTLALVQDSFWLHLTPLHDKDIKYPERRQEGGRELWVLPVVDNNYLRFEVHANAPWAASDRKGGVFSDLWKINLPNEAGVSAANDGVFELGMFAIPDFLTPRRDSLFFSVIDALGNRRIKSTIYYRQNAYDFKEDNIVVFPNPVHDRLRIKSINATSFQNGYVFIYTLGGEQIAARTYANGIIDFDFSTLPQGVYLLKIYDGKIFVTKRVIKH